MTRALTTLVAGGGGVAPGAGVAPGGKDWPWRPAAISLSWLCRSSTPVSFGPLIFWKSDTAAAVSLP